MDEKVFQKRVLDWSHDVFGFDFKEKDFFLNDSFHVEDLTAFVFASSDSVESRVLVLTDETGELLAGSVVDNTQKSVAVNCAPATIERLCSALSGKFAEKSDALIRYEKGADAKWWRKSKWMDFWLLVPCCVVFSLIFILFHADHNWSVILTTLFSLWASEYLSKKYGLGNLSDAVKDEIAARAILEKAKKIGAGDL